MNKPIVDKIAAAVLYEGYILYPYRPSVKNRQRWTFGGVYPQAYSTAQGGAEPCFMQTQSLLEAGRDSRLEVRIRFLHLVNRQVGKITARVAGGEPEFQEVESLQVGSKRFQSWQEAVEREVALAETSLTDLLLQPRRHSFRFPGDRNLEPIRTPEGDTVAVIVREQQPLEGLMEWRAEAVDQGLYRMTVKISNETQMDHTWARDRDRALRHAFVSTHTVLGVENGEFISLMAPGRRHQAAYVCVNIR